MLLLGLYRSAGSIDFSPPPEFLVETGPEGAFVVHYSPGCYSDVGDARAGRGAGEGGGHQLQRAPWPKKVNSYTSK